MKHRIGFIFVLSLFIITIVACDKLVTTPINKILTNPRDYAEKQVTISGTVVDTFSIVILKYFIVRDETGEMVVVTQKPMPAKDQKIKVSGSVQEAFSLGDKQLIVLIEDSGDSK